MILVQCLLFVFQCLMCCIPQVFQLPHNLPQLCLSLSLSRGSCFYDIKPYFSFNLTHGIQSYRQGQRLARKITVFCLPESFPTDCYRLMVRVFFWGGVGFRTSRRHFKSRPSHLSCVCRHVRVCAFAYVFLQLFQPKSFPHGFHFACVYVCLHYVSH